MSEASLKKVLPLEKTKRKFDFLLVFCSLIRTFAGMNEEKWTENVIIVDGDYIDKVVFDLTVNFERMLGRRIPQADMARWVECVALDGGLREGDHETGIVLIHEPKNAAMQYFVPGHYANELHGQAFRSHLGEFSFTAVTTEGMASKESLLADTLQIAAARDEVERIMVVAPNDIYNNVRAMLREADAKKRLTLFTMQPPTGGSLRQELLGYSLLAALGISSEEIMEKITNSK